MMFPFLKKAITNAFTKPSTEAFPCPEGEGLGNYRGRIAFDGEKCIDCGMCIKVCSPAAIELEREADDGGEHIWRTFDLTSCTFCATCVDFCEEGAIQMTKDYHMVGTKHEDLLVKGVTFKKKIIGDLTCDIDNCIYCGLCARNCPQNAITVDRTTKTWQVDHEKCVKCGICIGKCPKKVLSFAEPKPEGVVFDAEKCVYCTLCAKKCPVGAIEVDRASKTWKIDRDTCIKCGACIKGCPKQALSMGPIEE